MILEAASLLYLAGDFAYHRWFQDQPQDRREPQRVQLPSVRAGAPVPLLYGRVRIRQPILIWNAQPTELGGNFLMNMTFALGCGMNDNNSTSRIHDVWAGDLKAFWFRTGDREPTGDGGPETPVTLICSAHGISYGSGVMEFLNGKPTQIVAQDGADNTNAVTYTGRMLLATGEGGGGEIVDNIPGYRGFLLASFFTSGAGQWVFSSQGASVPAYSFEASSYYDHLGNGAQVGDDANPFAVLYDLYVAKLSRIGLSASVIDLPSWQACAATCASDSIGYSRCIDDAKDLDEHIQEVLRVADGVLRWNPATGLIEAKLIRPDFDPATVPHITKGNCDKVSNCALGGWMNVANKVNIEFNARDRDYNTDVEPGQNPANAVRQDGQLNEITLQFPGICERAQAVNTAARELYARSVPLMKMRVHVSSDEFADVLQGDAVKVTLPRPPINGYFRVADVDRGTLTDGKIALDLITDTSSYVHRGLNPRPTHSGTPVGGRTGRSVDGR